MTARIDIDGTKHELAPGLTRGREIYELASGTQDLVLNRVGGIDIPLDRQDRLVIIGNESFVSGTPGTEDNPPLRKKITVRFNETTLELPRAKISGKDLKERDDEFPDGRLFADIDAGPDAEIDDTMTLLVQEENSFFVIPPCDESGPEEPVDTESCARHGRRPPKGHRYRIKIDRKKYVVDTAEISGAGILELAGKSPEEWKLHKQMRGGRRERIKAGDIVDVAQPGVERFGTSPRNVQGGGS